MLHINGKAGVSQRWIAATVALIFAGASSMHAQSATPIPMTPGWYQLPDTKLRSVCPAVPSIQGIEGCSAVTEDWSGGTFDTVRNRLLIWGGGHSGYFGNEVYALSLTDQTMRRINEPSLNPPSTCSNDGSMPDGTPVSRHTYNHLAYIAHADRMYAFGGSAAPCGFMKNDTWTFSLGNLSWQRMGPSGPIPIGNYGWVTAYDPATQKVYIHDYFNLHAYTYETNTYSIVKASSGAITQGMTGVIDTKRQKLVMVGDGTVIAYDLAPGAGYTRQVWATTGANSIVAQNYIGLAYDPAGDRIVAWDGGDTVYALNPGTRVWTSYTYPNGPGPARNNGTYGRFAYSTASGLFVVVNSIDANAYVLRLPGAPVSPNPPTDIVTR